MGLNDGQHRASPLPPKPGEASACAICANVVDQVSDTETREFIGYRHTAANQELDADHPVVPVPVRAIQTTFLCDFCMVPGARWELPVRNHDIGAGYVDADGWAACDDCAACLRRDDWGQLARRAQSGNRARGTHAPLAAFTRMFEQLRPHISGEVRLHV